MAKRGKNFHPDEPLKHADHRRPRTRREFIAQGFSAGLGAVIGSSMFGMFGSRQAQADIASELLDFGNNNDCKVGGALTGKIPFICFDLAGGANIAGSNVLVGGAGGQLDFLSTAGYRKLGVPGDMLPAMANAGEPSDFINQELGLAFHTESAMLRGILERFSAANRAMVNGAVIPARSENDTGNNPHNPMYGINRAGANGQIMALVGSRNSESGGNSLAPPGLINPEVRPTKIDRISDVRGLIDVGELGTFFPQQADRVAVMESIANISHSRIGTVNTGLQSESDQAIKDRALRCGYIESAYLTDRFDSSDALDPTNDPLLVGGPTAPFTLDDMGDREFAKTASIARLVLEGQAGAGCITMGGYDYHTGDRSTGERRDLRVGRCIGACLQYAANLGKPLMVYIFSDGSVFSNGMVDDSQDGGGKGVWTGDNQQTAASFFMVYNPDGPPQLLGGTPEDNARHQQIGRFTAEGNVNTAGSPAANSVTGLVDMVCLNYMALHGDQGNFATTFPGHSLGADLDRWTAFSPIV
ncbi:general secretion pathway protein GspF [Exilibacterium tricleocarpae]|uniref:General secretion pathway protein GspF n=1 Tax=Exilibacterium tricleocarpae TaxID=2591008 RepID=A0A545TZ04_9GAMM|nr:general secretion pathway protein GspF [Exilibacterium tricleocarpae]TQV82445.1 general secretion pathway protein GspF [Exilibacterium tricleocarpae]